MADAEIVKSRLKAIIDFNEIGNGRTVVRKDVLNDALSVIEDLQAEIERLKADNSKLYQEYLDAIPDDPD